MFVGMLFCWGLMCSKKFRNRNQIEHHLNSKRHKELAEYSDLESEYSVFYDDEKEANSEDEEDLDEIIDRFINNDENLLECLFCSHRSWSFEEFVLKLFSYPY